MAGRAGRAAGTSEVGTGGLVDWGSGYISGKDGMGCLGLEWYIYIYTCICIYIYTYIGIYIYRDIYRDIYIYVYVYVYIYIYWETNSLR